MGVSILKKRLIEFLAISGMVVLSFLVFLVDIFILKNTVTEISLTEFVQEVILILIAGIFIYLAFQHPEVKYGMVLIAGFFCNLLIRELDFLLDTIFGSWLYVALPVALFCIVLAVRHKENVLFGLNHFCKSDSYYIMACGLIMVLVFSRLIGMQILWRQLLKASYIRVVKNAMEEGSELVCYTLCLISAWKYKGSFAAER